MVMPPAFKASKARRASRSRSKTAKPEILEWKARTPPGPTHLARFSTKRNKLVVAKSKATKSPAD
jgi:hypothetical protein